MKRIRLIAIAFVAALQSMQAGTSYADEVHECSREILLSYFPETFVKNSLEKFNVDPSSRSAIITDLGKQDQEILKKVEEKALQKNPNPLKSPVQREEAVALFKETLFEVFSDVMKKHGESNEAEIQAMLDDIQHQKARYFVSCIERKKKGDSPENRNQKIENESAKKNIENQNNDEDEDYDDLDDYDESDQAYPLSSPNTYR